jgi:hypothetical protein
MTISAAGLWRQSGGLRRTSILAFAGMAAGILARTQHYTHDGRRKLLSDALALMTARKRGLVPLTANIVGFDLLSQLRTDAQVIYYRPI